MAISSRCRIPAQASIADAPRRRFDAVLVDIDHSPRKLLHPRHAALYEPEGLARLADHLNPGGVFALWSNDPPDEAFQRVLADVFAISDAHVVTFDNWRGDHDASNTVYVAVKADLPSDGSRRCEPACDQLSCAGVCAAGR